MEKQGKSRRYTVIMFLMMTCSCMYHPVPVDPVPTKEAVIEADCQSRYLSKIEAVKNSDGTGYSYSYSCSDHPVHKVKILVKE